MPHLKAITIILVITRCEDNTEQKRQKDGTTLQFLKSRINPYKVIMFFFSSVDINVMLSQNEHFHFCLEIPVTTMN